MAVLYLWSLAAALLLVLIVLRAAPALVKSVIDYRRLSHAVKDLPGWPRHWLWGNLHNLLPEESVWLKWHDAVYSSRRKISATWMGPFVPMVHIHHCSEVHQVLQFPKDANIYRFLSPWLGDGLLVSQGKKWFRNRHLLTPAFHFDILKPYVKVYNSCLETFIGKCHAAADRREPVKLFDNLSRLTLDILMQCAFSNKSNCQDVTVASQHPYICSVYDLVQLTTHRIYNPFYHNEWVFFLTPSGRKTRKACSIVHSHSRTVINNRRKALEYGGATLEASTEELKKKKKTLDFLDVLLLARDEDGEGLTDLEIQNEVDTFMFEGHDTTTSGLSWTLYLLAKHPEHQEKVREEVRNVLNGKEWLEFDDLKDLKYTQWCIKESMRLYPPVFQIFRVADKDVELDGHMIPKGMTLAVSIHDIHRHPDTWDRPDEFDPVRFHPDDCKKRDPYAYIPFSTSQRNCIGQNFALNEEKVIVASIVQRFSLSLVEGHKVELVPKVVLRTKYDIKVHFTPL